MSGPHWAEAMIALAFGLAGGLLSGAAQKMLGSLFGRKRPLAEDGPVATRGLTLVDEAGRPRGLLRLIRYDRADYQVNDAMLLLTDEADRWAIRLSAGNEGPFLRFTEGKGPRLGVGIKEDGSPGVELVDSGGRSRASLSLDNDGTALLALRDREGVVRGKFQVSAAGEPSLELADGKGNTLARLP